MSSIFVSYKREDEVRVRRIVEAMREAGLNVWWDRDIQPNQSWRAAIEEKLESCALCMVVWSITSTGPDGAYVKEEAERAKGRGVYLGVLVDKVAPPFGFAEIQAVDLSNWRGGKRGPLLAHLIEVIRARLVEKPSPTAPTVPKWRRISIVAALGAAATIIGVWSDLGDVGQSVCRIPGVRSACGVLGVGNVPTAQEIATWKAAIDSASGDGLRAYLRSYPNGAYASEAERRLNACTRRQTVGWAALPAMSPQVSVPLSADIYPSKAAASKALEVQGAQLAMSTCDDFRVSPDHRLAAPARFELESLDCIPRTGGTSCSAEGRAVCNIEQRTLTETEQCSPAN